MSSLMGRTVTAPMPDEATVIGANPLVTRLITLSPDLSFTSVNVGDRTLAVMSPRRTFTRTGAHCSPPARCHEPELVLLIGFRSQIGCGLVGRFLDP
jgi:hypothetical protein